MRIQKIKIAAILILLCCTVITGLNLLHAADITIIFSGVGRAVTTIHDLDLDNWESGCDGDPNAKCTIKVVVPEE